MRVDAFAIRLRPRVNFEAADLGVRLCQSAARDVYTCYLAVWLPVVALCLSTYEIASWLPITLLWWLKPWLDRSILFALSRAAFGQSTRPSDLWSAGRQVWWSQLLITLTTRRLSPWRAFTQPVYQLEGLRGGALRARVRLVRAGYTRAGVGLLTGFGGAETAIYLGLFSLLLWFAPKGSTFHFSAMLNLGYNIPAWIDIALAVSYALAVGFVEPFYVAGGFGLYLNRRAELEAWDIEQEFRRAFGA